MYNKGILYDARATSDERVRRSAPKRNNEGSQTEWKAISLVIRSKAQVLYGCLRFELEQRARIRIVRRKDNKFGPLRSVFKVKTFPTSDGQ